MSFRLQSGTPQFLQGNYAPTQSEAVNMDQFNFGTLTFFWDRLNAQVLWLQSVDSNNLQTWAAYPSDLTSLCTISILPIIGSLLNWAIADYDPTSNETIPPQLFDGSYGILWWNTLAGNLFELTAFSDNGDGTYTQTWTQVV